MATQKATDTRTRAWAAMEVIKLRRSLVFVLTLIFVFAIFAGPAAPKADAVVVSSIVVGTVIAAMAAAGIGITVSGMTASQLSDWVGEKLSSWATSLGGSVEDHINGNLITTTASGIIAIGTSAANSIAQFLGWLQTDEALTDNSTSIVFAESAVEIPVQTTVPTNNEIQNNGILIAGYNGIASYNSYMIVYDIGQNKAAAAYYDSGNKSYIIVATKNQNSNAKVYKLQPSYPPASVFSINMYNSTLGKYYYCSVDTWKDYTKYCPKYNSLQDCLEGLEEFLDGNSGSMSIQTGTITIPTIDTTTQDKWFLDVGAEPGATVETATDGVIADTIAGDLTVSGEVAEEEPEFVVDGPIAIEGLAQVFPFCIPFDIYALLSCLSAEPQTPVFTVRFVVPGVINQEFTIDLSPFNTVAQIVRTLELLAFIVGLALVTRQRFLRS